MNASEIEYLEAHLPAGLQSMPSPEQMERVMARIKRERNEHIAASLASAGTALKRACVEIRRIAVACTAARLHHPV